MKKILSFCAALLFAFAANAAVININTETADALRLALNGASDGDEIVMAAGTYVESNGNYINFAGKHVTVKAAEGAEVLIQPQVSIQVTEGGTAHFVGVKFDASRLQELADWYEHLIYPADAANNSIILDGCEFYGFNFNKSMIYCSTSNVLSAITINNCYFHNCLKSILFVENTAAAISAQVTNSTFADIATNTESYWAGIIDIRNANANLLVDHCTFYNVIPMNTDYSCVSKITLANGVTSNSIFMLPTAQDNIRAMRGVTATNCITFNYLKDSGTGIHSSVTKTNCLQVDPAFVDPDNGNFTLGEGSPALTMNDGEPIGDPRWVPAPAAPAVTTIYNWSAVAAEKVGVTTLGANGVEESTVKIHTNSVTVNGIKVGSSYVYADGKWVAIKPAEGGFKAGDVLSLAAVFNNNDDTKYAQVDVYAADGATRLFRSDSASTINGRTKAGDPIVQTYTLASNQDSLFFGRYGNTTMYITLLKVERSAAAETLTAPEAAPAAPEYPANQVKAVYSATYNADCGYGEWGSGTVYTQEEFGKKFVTTNLGYFGLTFEGDAALNCSAMEKLHLDVWIANDASLRVVPIHGGAEVGVTKNLVGQQWNSIEIALSEFEGVTDWSNVYQIKIDNAREITFWVNNIYFYTTVAPAVDETAPADVTAIAQNPSYFSVEIKANATDASGAILYSVLQGELIVATGHAASGADAVITVAGLTPATEYNFSVIAKDESANAAEPVAVTATTIAAPAAAPAPAIQAPLVKSIYSDVYTRVPAEVDTYNAAWWEPTVQTEGLIAAGDHALFYAAKGTGMCGWQFSEFNATGYPYLHLDIYPLAAGTIDIYPVCKDVADGPYHKTTPALVANQWNHVVLDYSALDISKIFQIGWINYYALNGYFIDNVFFSSRAEATAAPEADRRIYAYGLNVERDGDNYTFTFNANIAPAEANFIFYNEGVEIGSVAIANPVAGLNTKVLAINEIPEGENLTWAVELKANPVYSFNKLAEGESLMKCHLAIDNSPESDYFGRMYVANRAGSGAGGIYVYNQDYTVHTSNTLAGQPKWQSMGRPSVAVDGTVYIGDWGDGHGGVYVMDPATLTATCLFQGTQASNGLWTNAEGTAMGSSTAAVGVYGEGANTVLYAMNEDASTAGATLYAHGVNVYQLGQTDGSVLNTWNVAPTMTFALLDNAAQMFVINPTSKGAFFSCSRAKPNNASGARSLQFYNTNGERTYVALPEGETADLTGSLGGGCAVSRDEDILAIVDGDGNILVYDVTWNDATPALTKSTKYNTEFAALGSLCFDYAGNIVVTAGANYNNSTANKLVAYGVPTDENEIIVPAKKALVVTGTGTGTAIDNSFVAPKIEKIIRNGQVYIVRDGVVYTVTGTRVQ